MVDFYSGRSDGTADKRWPSMMLSPVNIVDALH
jgi:hypothetical protein